MADKKPQKKGAGRSAGTGNVTIDLGEEIDKKLRSVGMAGAGSFSRPGGPGRPAYRPGGYRPGLHRPWLSGGDRRGGQGSGLYRPGLYGGYRPWYASQLGAGRWMLGDKLGLPKSLDTGSMLTGVGLGIAGNRALVRVTPELIKTDSRLAHEAIAFAVGLIPVLVKRNSMTVGVALPGLVFLGGAIVDWGLDAAIGKRSALRGGTGPAVGQDAALAARQKLADIQARIHAQRQQPSPLPRVVAKPTGA